MIQVIEGKDVDVIEPFPVGQLDHVVQIGRATCALPI